MVVPNMGTCCGFLSFYHTSLFKVFILEVTLISENKSIVQHTSSLYVICNGIQWDLIFLLNTLINTYWNEMHSSYLCTLIKIPRQFCFSKITLRFVTSLTTPPCLWRPWRHPSVYLVWLPPTVDNRSAMYTANAGNISFITVFLSFTTGSNSYRHITRPLRTWPYHEINNNIKTCWLTCTAHVQTGSRLHP